jgi:hypothetical protein
MLENNFTFYFLGFFKIILHYIYFFQNNVTFHFNFQNISHFISIFQNNFTFPLIFQNGVNPNFQFEEKLAPLHLSSKNGHIQCTFYLLQFNANVNMLSKVEQQITCKLSFKQIYSNRFNTVITNSSNVPSTSYSSMPMSTCFQR